MAEVKTDLSIDLHPGISSGLSANQNACKAPLSLYSYLEFMRPPSCGGMASSFKWMQRDLEPPGRSKTKKQDALVWFLGPLTTWQHHPPKCCCLLTGRVLTSSWGGLPTISPVHLLMYFLLSSIYIQRTCILQALVPKICLLNFVSSILRHFLRT